MAKSKAGDSEELEIEEHGASNMDELLESFPEITDEGGKAEVDGEGAPSICSPPGTVLPAPGGVSATTLDTSRGSIAPNCVEPLDLRILLKMEGAVALEGRSAASTGREVL